MKDVRIRESYCGCPESGLWNIVPTLGEKGKRFRDGLTFANLVGVISTCLNEKTMETYPQNQDVAQIHKRQYSDVSFALNLVERGRGVTSYE